MWIIKDKDLKEVVNKFFKDSEIEASFLCSGKDQFISVYDPNNWNGYPTVIPPESNNPWLVQHKDGSILIANFSEGLDPYWFSNDSPISYVLHDIVAFRKLPEPYK